MIAKIITLNEGVTMCVSWKKGFNPEVILKKLSNIRSMDGQQVSFSGFEYHEYIAILKSMIEIDDDISTPIRNTLIVRAFHEAAKKPEIKPGIVISELKKLIKDHHDMPSRHYSLVTTINLDIKSELSSYFINGCSLKFYKNLPKKYVNARNKAISEVSSWLIGGDPAFNYYVIGHVNAKNEFDAAEKILDSMDIVRGVWNLHTNKSMVLSFGGRRKAINQIALGALHTVHNESGELASEMYWYETEFRDDRSRVDFSKKSYSALRFTKNVRSFLKSHRYKNEVEVGIVRYVRALDSGDYNAAFIKLWSVLEYLTSTLRDGYDKTIRRTVFQYNDREYHGEALEHLRQYRNRTVHAGSGDDEIETHLYQLKRYVEVLLKFHITNRFDFGSLSEAARLMDLSPDKDALKSQISLFKAGIRFLGG